MPSQATLRIKKSQRFAVRDKELFDLHLKVFATFCLNTMQHTKQEVFLLKKLFKATINPDNIRQYINVSADKIYTGIAHNCLHKYSNNQPIK